MIFGLRRKPDRGAVLRDPGRTAVTRTKALVMTRNHPVRLGGGLASAVGRSCQGLRVVVERNGPAVLVRAGGSVDASNAAVWRRLVGEAARITAIPGPLIVDTTGLEFMAVCAFAALAEESAGCRRRGIKLCLVSNQPITGRVVDAAGLGDELALFGSVDDALRPLSGPGCRR